MRENVVRVETEKLEKLREEIERNPLLVKAREEEAAATLAKRREVAAKLEGLQQEAEATIPVLRAEVVAQGAELAAYDAAREGIVNRLRAAQVALMEENLRLDHERSAVQAVLIETADPRLDEAITWFREKREALTQTQADIQTRAGAKNLYTERKTIHTFSPLPRNVA